MRSFKKDTPLNYTLILPQRKREVNKKPRWQQKLIDKHRDAVYTYRRDNKRRRTQ